MRPYSPFLAAVLLLLLAGCAGSARKAAFSEGTYAGAWNRADAERVATDLADASKDLSWTAKPKAMGSVTASDSSLDAGTLRSALAKAFAASETPKPGALRFEAKLSRSAGPASMLRYQVLVQVLDSAGATLWTADRLIEKQP